MSLQAQDTVDPQAITSEAIDRLRFAQEIAPEASGGIEVIVEHLERGLRGADGNELILDSCHLAPEPQGLTAWIETRQAILRLQQLLDQANRRKPSIPMSPAVQGLLSEVRDQVVDAYLFLADVAVQEARAFADEPSAATQTNLAIRRFADAEAEIAAGDVVRGMQSLRQAWEHAHLAVEVDLTADSPLVNLETPTDGATVFSSPVDVAGMVQLLTLGTVGADDVVVTVNGQTAEVVQRSFLARDVPLREGLNALVAVARSSEGGVGTACVALRLDPTARPQITAVGGTAQQAAISTLLPESLAVRVGDDSGNPLAGEQVIFRVVQGDGTLAGGVRGSVVETDADGIASIGFTLGSRAGVAVHRVRATAVGIEGDVIFSPTALTSEADRIHAVSGDNQRGLVGEPLALPLVAVVTDAGQNLVAGAPVTFEVVGGGGSVDGEPETVVATDSDGRAAVTFTLGTEPGLDNHLVRATFPGLAREPVTFQASGFLAGDPADTRIRGVVLDGQGEPVPGVTLSVEGADGAVRADASGQFVLTGVPVGEVALEMDATTASRPGVWSSLSFHLHTLPGVVNRLPKPIFTLPLDVDQGKVVGGDEDVTLEVPEAPGFSLTVLAGSATFSDGSSTGVVSVTPVHADKVPMSPGSGMQPRFIVTVQPAGVVFEPPAPVRFPNVDGLPAGAVTEMFSFDHDLGDFVSIGTGTVSEDGTVVRSDPGFGIVKAGWHCAAPQSESGAGSSLQVEITTAEPIILEEGQSLGLEASGDPSRDVELNWSIADPDIASIDSSNSFRLMSSPDSALAGATVTGGPKAGRTTATATILCTTTGETDSDEIEVIRPKVEIEAQAIDQDDPTNETFDVQDPEVVYGGSIPTTSDNLKLEAVIEPEDLEVARYIWRVTGPGAENYTPPEPSPNAVEWDVGEIAPEAGELEFTVEVGFAEGGSVEGERKQEVGIRTDDIVVIGWIDPEGVPLSGTGLDSGMLRFYPLDGSASMSSLQKVATTSHLGVLATGSTIHPVVPRPMTTTEKMHILNWMFRFAANFCSKDRCPPTAFADSAEVTRFGTMKDTSYKLFNRYQVKYRVTSDGSFFSGGVTAIHDETEVGVTNDPIFDSRDPGAEGPNEGRQGTFGNLTFQINDGTPTGAAVRAFNTLADPLKWNHIGSRIEYSVASGSEPSIFNQVYPTYYIFQNLELVETIPQAPNPIDNFNSDPYPPGPAPYIP